MNWLLPAVAVFLLLAAWDGHRKGFIKKLVGIVSLALTLILTSIASPFVAEFLKSYTGIYSTLQNSISASDAELLDTLQALGLEDAVSGYLADQILQALALLVTLLLVGVLVRGIAFSLGLAARLPVLHGINKLAGLVFGFAEGVLVVDHEGCIRSVNATLVRLFPRAAHAEGLQPVEVIPSPDLQKGIESLKHAVPEKPVQFEMDNMSGRKLQVLICPIVGESKLLMAVAVFHDITEMSVLMEMRRDFVANVSHELRTPLTAIMGYAESLKRYVSEPRALHFLEVIDRNSQYMATMVKDLLQLSSIENGAIPMDIKPMPASMVIRGGMDLCRSSAESKKLEFVEKLDDGDFSVNADAEYLTRVVRNLLENACRYAPEGSQIVISAEPDKENGMAVFRVADSGPGIPPELRVRVFERFYRVEKHRGGQVSTGLGLAICKHIVERHGGCISIEDGPGCIVKFTVPLA